MLPSARLDRLLPGWALDGGTAKAALGQCYQVKYSNTVFCTVLYYTILYCTVLYCTVLLYYIPDYVVLTPPPPSLHPTPIQEQV